MVRVVKGSSKLISIYVFLEENRDGFRRVNTLALLVPILSSSSVENQALAVKALLNLSSAGMPLFFFFLFL